MAIVTIGTDGGFDVNNFWVANRGLTSNESLEGLTGSTGSPILGEQRETYSEFAFDVGGLRYNYTGEWQFTANRGLILGSAEIDGVYDGVTIESGSGTVATIVGGVPLPVDLGAVEDVTLVQLLLGNVVGTLLGDTTSTPAIANLHLDATPTLPELALAGNDIQTGGAGADTLRGYGGNDLLRGLSGADALVGGSGEDIADYSFDQAYGGNSGIVANLELGVVSDGFGSFDTVSEIEGIYATAFADQVLGNAGNNVIELNDGDDYANGGAGNDIIRGGAGNDGLVGGAGNDIINGGTGLDNVDYSSSTSGVTVGLYNGQAYDGMGGQDTLIDLEHVIGSNFDDVIAGDAGSNTLIGGAGGDAIFAGYGNDYIVGGSGADYLVGDEGFDIFAFDASDFLGAASWDRIDDFSESATSFDFLSFSGISREDLILSDYGTDVIITSASFNGGIVVSNMTAAQIQDQLLFT